MKNLMSAWVDSAWRVWGVKDVLLVVCEAFLSVLTVYTHYSCSEALCRLFSNLLHYQDLGLYWASSSRLPLCISGRVLTECKPVHPSPPHSSKVCYAWNFTTAYSECPCGIMFRSRSSYIFVFNWTTLWMLTFFKLRLKLWFVPHWEHSACPLY